MDLNNQFIIKEEFCGLKLVYNSLKSLLEDDTGPAEEDSYKSK